MSMNKPIRYHSLFIENCQNIGMCIQLSEIQAIHMNSDVGFRPQRAFVIYSSSYV